MKKFLRVALPVPLYRLFDYLPPKGNDISQLKAGLRIKVPFGRRKLVGILLETTNHTDILEEKLKPAIEILDEEPVIDDILTLCQWAANYYHYPLGEVLFYALPTLLRQGKAPIIKESKEKTSLAQEKESKTKPLILNKPQQQAVNAVVNKLNQFQAFLLDGVTGSGKTEVYLQIIDQILKDGRQVLVLVPEIGLTPQTVDRFQKRFDVPILMIHSGLNDKKRLNGWLKAKNGEAKIIIGTRSAIFTPCESLGLIVIDEEHDLSFKQQDNFRYSAKDLGIVRAKQNNIPIILGSATPALESLHNLQKKAFEYLHLPERAGEAVHPDYCLVDIRNESLDHGLSKKLIERIKKQLENNSQVMLFLNRRGYAPTLMCHQCGWIAKCKRCDANYTLHNDPKHLRCHHCNTIQSMPHSCPDCGNKALQNIGVGTERLEKHIKKLFPDNEVIRIDRDTTRRKDAMQNILDKIRNGKGQILVGTQMIAKGHHFPNVTLVGVINADGGFFSADFRGIEKMAQTLIQVSGRAGRAEKPGEVLIQTYYPDHPLLLKLIHHGYAPFAKQLLEERKASHLPPYSYFALLRASAMKAEKPEVFLTEVKALAENLSISIVRVLGPIPATMHRRKSHYHAQLLLQSPSRSALQEMLGQLIPKIEKLKSVGQVKWSVDVDPMEMG